MRFNRVQIEFAQIMVCKLLWLALCVLHVCLIIPRHPCISFGTVFGLLQRRMFAMPLSLPRSSTSAFDPHCKGYRSRWIPPRRYSVDENATFAYENRRSASRWMISVAVHLSGVLGTYIQVGFMRAQTTRLRAPHKNKFLPVYLRTR